ncbi:FkbM family methyltransferase [Pedobacter nototheniae]|uniref:FkbM family methyltransferase n=1 Tax=Pedobacter nototheniae TaxID=2488994 RepID=UPI00292D0A13|nr:FkbM family methyltransferase [Pedobacter nototheniae]
MLNTICRFILNRKPFKGQLRLFFWLYNSKLLKPVQTISRPLKKQFRLKLNTQHYIDACIYFTGDYEPYLKTHYKKYVSEGMTVLDIGANIGFHTLYFATLTGTKGKVIAFEPIEDNFNILKENIELNNLSQVQPVQIALGNNNEILNIHLSKNLKNPGAHNLFEEGEKNTKIDCKKGDDYLNEYVPEIIAFIKIDVEGYEYPVLQGLEKTIQKDKPVIIFEYDRNYQLKSTKEPEAIFKFLEKLGYGFTEVDGYGNTKPFIYQPHISGAEIIALPK